MLGKAGKAGAGNRTTAVQWRYSRVRWSRHHPQLQHSLQPLSPFLAGMAREEDILLNPLYRILQVGQSIDFADKKDNLKD